MSVVNWQSFSGPAASGQVPCSSVFFRMIMRVSTLNALASRSGVTPRSIVRRNTY
jgi:hypothetical protein